MGRSTSPSRSTGRRSGATPSNGSRKRSVASVRPASWFSCARPTSCRSGRLTRSASPSAWYCRCGGCTAWTGPPRAPRPSSTSRPRTCSGCCGVLASRSSTTGSCTRARTPWTTPTTPTCRRSGPESGPPRRSGGQEGLVGPQVVWPEERGRLVRVEDQAVAGGVDGQHRLAAQLAVEGDVVGHVCDGGRIGADSRSGGERGQVSVQVETRRAVERLHLGVVDRALELLGVVHAGVPGGVPARASLQLRAEEEEERAIDLRQPQELVLLLGRVILGRRLGQSAVEPTWEVAYRRGQRDAGAALRRRLRGADHLVRKRQVGEGVGDVDELQVRARGEQLLDHELAVEALVPHGSAAGDNPAHGQGGGEAGRVALQ